MDDSESIKLLSTEKASALDVTDMQVRRDDLKQILATYVANIDSDIATTDQAVQAVVSARAAVDSDNTVNPNIKAELRALENAVNLLKAETRRYRQAFVWMRDNF